MRTSRVFVVFAALLMSGGALAQAQQQRIASFSVGPDTALTYPNNPTDPNHLVDLPDEHTTFFPPAAPGAPYVIFGASKLSGGTGGAVVLESTDLQNFTFATALGYNRQVMAPPTAIDQCNAAYQFEFDGNYAAPGSVVQDPTLPPGNLIMLYEAENHCPGGVNQQPFYATVGFARSSDNGKTWPAPQNGVLGGPSRHPVLQSSDPQPSVPHLAMGDAIPSAFVDKSAGGDYYLYVTYLYRTATGSGDGLVRVARAKLGADPLTFFKWYNGSFSQPGIGGLDSGATPSIGCSNGAQAHSEISFNDDLGLYLMLFVCVNGPTGARVGAWYYSTATSLDAQNWTAPQVILNSQFPLTSPCPGQTSGGQFDGWYPSTVSPGAAAGHTKLTGYIFFLNGCDTGARQFMSRTFTIVVGAATPPQINSGGIVNGASFTLASASLAPGSIAAVFGFSLSDGTVCVPPNCGPNFDAGGKAIPTMGSAQITFNGFAAPILSTPGTTQLNVQVPVEVAGSTSATVQVTVNGQSSAASAVSLASVAPGLISIKASGVGQGAILNDKDANLGVQSLVAAVGSAPNAHPAAAGDVIEIYGTGLGAVSPAVATGMRPQGLPQTTVKPVVTIGGQPATVLFSGLASCCVGLNQVNVMVPAGIAPSDAVQVVLTIGGVRSNTVTIAVQ